MSDEVLRARAFLSRIAEPGCVPVWALVGELGPVEAARAIRAGQVSERVADATSARLASADPEADLAAAERHGIRLICPEHDDWPHFALAGLEHAGVARLTEYASRKPKREDGGEPIPPLALWVKGAVDVSTLATRSVSIVGSRAATGYGEHIAANLAYALAQHEVTIVSGGAVGIDGAAHRGALAARGVTVLVSAAGLDRPYPAEHEGLFARVAENGVLISEIPPGGAPHRQRFLTRNRLVASFGTGTVVVEAQHRSGARNTVSHCRVLGRTVMAVPGPVTSPMSAGCHDLIRYEPAPATLVTCADDVLAVIGAFSSSATGAAHAADERPLSEAELRRALLDSIDPVARRVFDGLRMRRAANVDEIAARSAVAVTDVLQSLPVLELAGLVSARPDGYVIRPLRRVVA